ncbi:RidA family protein [Sediminispirochaeta smaragdinae]|uniref:Endoribonuclease L-PSP n=1 Tax=Sediminispirochaeta smaragdinae (strain DSM 11293 / JCM 15392 / SEBR 4228) TaxID=573413 RepID=E1R8R7_SEDSS|nr:RidA family protein [Sediminispirochaeta smaragdinae]ADK81824.1 endoribonuclease L-PSP [Sediminispirochaeta smaragdinae DSM 11293]
MKKIITTDGAPKAIGPYSQAIEVDGCIYTSGQLPIDPKTGQMPETVEAQTRQSLENVKAILKQRGLNLGTVFKTTVFLSDMNNFSKMNAVYAEYFSGSFPARSCVEVARLPKDAKVEIEVIAAE